MTKPTRCADGTVAARETTTVIAVTWKDAWLHP